jgi:hypothetical protein
LGKKHQTVTSLKERVLSGHTIPIPQRLAEDQEQEECAAAEDEVQQKRGESAGNILDNNKYYFTILK